MTPINRRTALQSTLALISGYTLRADGPIPVKIDGGTVDVTIQPADFDLPQSALLDWVKLAGRAVTAYYGKYPVPRARVEILVREGQGVEDGHSDGDDGIWCRISVGRHTTVEQLNRDWMLTHEMVHFSFPSMRRRHHWIEEGTATYVEPIARVEIGNLTAGQVWSDMMRDMHQGLPEEGDRGLDNTHTWGRTYWGGALYCLLADIGIRKHTANAKGLRDALRAINRAGGAIDVDWPLEKALQIGDQATGSTVLMDLYAKMGPQPMAVDLPDLWKQLGVRRENGRIVYDDHAPLAGARQAIMRA